MPPELKAQVEEAARASNRSINAEIVHRLEGSFRPMEHADIIEAMRKLIERSDRERAALFRPRGIKG